MMIPDDTADHNGEPKDAAAAAAVHATREAWDPYAARLAAWTMTRLVNRVDVWGGYHDIADRGKVLDDGTRLETVTTRPGKKRRGKVFLDRNTLTRHFGASAPSQIVGLHTTTVDNLCRWVVIEIDWHGQRSTAPQINLAAATGWLKRLREDYGVVGLLIDSNGRGGYHLWIIFGKAIPAADAFALGKWLVADHPKYGMDAPPETFPKQPQVNGKCGNWLRLPGLHHTSAVFS